ncbi:MAG: SigE family RNA polymerase sigma factor [Frankiaceae bacterium]
MDASEGALPDEEFAAFVAARSQALLRTACLLTGDWATAEDLLQTALAKTYLRWSRIDRRGTAEAYVRRALVNTSTSWWRRRWRGEVPTATLPDRAGGETTPGVVERSSLWPALMELPRKQRAAVVLRYYEDRPDSEVARLLGCSEQTVRSQCSRALAKLRESQHLSDHAPDRRPPLPPVEEEAR